MLPCSSHYLHARALRTSGLTENWVASHAEHSGCQGVSTIAKKLAGSRRQASHSYSDQRLALICIGQVR
jgi:hypothetical protein